VVGVNLTGAGHYFDTIPWIAALSATAIVSLYRGGNTAVSKSTVSCVVFFIIISLTLFFPWVERNLFRLAQTNLEPYKVESKIPKPAIIFFEPGVFLELYTQGIINTWTYHFRYFDKDLSDDVLWLTDRGSSENKKIMANYFPGRHAFRLVPGFDREKNVHFTVRSLAK
jgi:hypothetical protein